jgi:carboxymethylenebutenolidase
MGNDLIATTIELAGHNGDAIEAYVSRPAGDALRGGVVVIHHMPGFDSATKEIVRHFAVLGYDAICPNLHYRDAPGAAPDDAAAANRANGGVPDDQLAGDVAAAAACLRELPTSNGKVGTIGYCSGGRQSVLAGCRVDVDAVVDCYGAFVTGTPPPERPIKNLVDELPNLRAPLLGLFGNDDQHPSPTEVDELEQILSELGKPHEFHRYDGAGHAFFSVNRPAYRVEAALDGWDRITDFYARYLES